MIKKLAGATEPWLVVPLSLMWLGACSAPQGAKGPVAASEIAAEGVVVRASEDPLTHLDIYDPEKLFHLALEADRQERAERAAKIYRRLLDEFPESRFAMPARFNLGLLLEGEKRFGEAAEHYLKIAVSPLPSNEQSRRTWLDAHFRMAVCVSKVGQWWRAATVFDYVLDEDWISPSERLEALVGKGIALQEGGDGAGAEIVFSKALRLHREETSKTPVFEDRGLAAEAAFRMGEIVRERYLAVKLAFPQEVLMSRLEKKCELLLVAQSRYLRAIRYGDAHTVAAAGLRIGSLYEALYDMIVALEAPPELTQEQAEVYHQEVRDRVGILLEKALLAYERSLQVGRRADTAADWVAKLEAAVQRLQQLVLEGEPAAGAQPGLPGDNADS